MNAARPATAPALSSVQAGLLAAMADRELIVDRLFAAVNISFDTGASRDRTTRAWEHDSGLGASGALSLRLGERVFAGTELRFESAFDGMALNRFAGHADHTLYIQYFRIIRKFEYDYVAALRGLVQICEPVAYDSVVRHDRRLH